MSVSTKTPRPQATPEIDRHIARLRRWLKRNPRKPPNDGGGSAPPGRRPGKRQRPEPRVISEGDMAQTRRMAGFLCNGRASQDDLTQEGLVGRLVAMSRDRPGRGRLGAYATKFARGHMLKARKRGRRELPALVEADLSELTGDGRTAYELVTEYDDDPDEPPPDRRAALDRLMRRLPRRERLALTLRFGLDGKPPLSRVDVAWALGVSETNAARIERKAIAKLRGLAQSRETIESNAA